MRYLDTCPSCCGRGVQPAAVKRRGDSIVHGYLCPGCGHRWATARSLPAYSDPHATKTQPRRAA